jgi:hypothetical protein
MRRCPIASNARIQVDSIALATLGISDYPPHQFVGKSVATGCL